MLSDGGRRHTNRLYDKRVAIFASTLRMFSTKAVTHMSLSASVSSNSVIIGQKINDN